MAGVDLLGDDPIFVLGSGRCGSTFVQTILCKTDEIWIWGEHDGIVGRFLEWCRSVRSSDMLNRFTFDHAEDPIVVINGPLSADATRAAWLNGFTLRHIEALEREVVQALMVTNLPAGKRRWGFKEIRYGSGDGTAERLLQLFPAAKIVHVVRDPLETAESCMSAWQQPALQAALASGDLTVVRAAYLRYLAAWLDTSTYYMGLEQTMPDRVRTFRVEDLTADASPLMRFVGVGATASHALGHAKVNTNKRREAGGATAALLADFRSDARKMVAACATTLGYQLS